MQIMQAIIAVQKAKMLKERNIQKGYRVVSIEPHELSEETKGHWKDFMDLVCEAWLTLDGHNYVQTVHPMCPLQWNK